MSIVGLEEFKSYARNEIAAADDPVIQAAISAAELEVQRRLHRSVAVVAVDAEPTARTFVAPSGCAPLYIDDARAITAVSDNGTARTSGEYQLEPLDGLVYGQAMPYTTIRPLSFAWSAPSYPGQASVTVTARWGWVSIPAPIVEATKILAKDILGQRDVRNGLAGANDFGVVRVRENPTVNALLAPYIRYDRFGLA